MSVLLVVTEHPALLDEDRRKHFERIRRRLERLARARVSSVAYTDVTTLAGPDAVVLSGSFAPWAMHEAAALERLGEAVRRYDGPVLGICAGMQLQAMFAAGSVRRAHSHPATGFRRVRVLDGAGLLSGLGTTMTVFEHHTDEVAVVPPGFRILAESDDCRVEAMADVSRSWWGTQFHPEEFSASHPAGGHVLRNFFEQARARSS